MNLIFVIAPIAILIALFKTLASKKISQSLETCGTSFFIVTAAIASWLYLLAMEPSYNIYSISSLVSLPILCICSGYVATRTTENTVSMSAKIIAGIAFIPYLIITYFAFISLPSWVNYYAALLFVPCILLGLKFNQIHNKSSKRDAVTEALSWGIKL